MLLVNLAKDSSRLNSYISNTLLTQLEETFSAGEKTILYLNKRGQFSSIICKSCQYLLRCPNCDVSLSVHRYPAQCLCHVCSYSQPIPTKCIKCSSNKLEHIGIGTQQIEESLNNYFKQKKIVLKIFRFDTDTMKTKASKTEALQLLNSADIIIGTKMITTGFNFEKVGLIGVLLLEQELQIPEYNSEESVYTNLQQLLGRGGRKGQKTTTLIQSFIPENPVIQKIVESNYREFFLYTLGERKIFGFPPFSDFVILEYRHLSQTKSHDFLQKLYQKLLLCNEEEKKYSISFNESPMKKYNQYFYRIIIKGPHIRIFLKNISAEIMRNSGLSVQFP